MRRKVKLSEMYNAIGEYLNSHGDADVISISTHCNNKDQIQYSLDLCDLQKDSYDIVGKIEIKYQEL